MTVLRVPKGILPAGALLPLEEKVGPEVSWMLSFVGGVGKKLRGSAGEEGSSQPQVKSHPHSVPEFGKNFTSLSLYLLCFLPNEDDHPSSWALVLMS